MLSVVTSLNTLSGDQSVGGRSSSGRGHGADTGGHSRAGAGHGWGGAVGVGRHQFLPHLSYLQLETHLVGEH